MPVSAATKADASSARRALQAADNLAAALEGTGSALGCRVGKLDGRGCWGAFGGGGGGNPEFAWSRARCCWAWICAGRVASTASEPGLHAIGASSEEPRGRTPAPMGADAREHGREVLEVRHVAGVMGERLDGARPRQHEPRHGAARRRGEAQRLPQVGRSIQNAVDRLADDGHALVG